MKTARPPPAGGSLIIATRTVNIRRVEFLIDLVHEVGGAIA
jgi:hypothetical protein